MHTKKVGLADFSVVESNERLPTLEAIVNLATAVYHYQIQLRARTERALFRVMFAEDE